MICKLAIDGAKLISDSKSTKYKKEKKREGAHVMNTLAMDSEPGQGLGPGRRAARIAQSNEKLFKCNCWPSVDLLTEYSSAQYKYLLRSHEYEMPTFTPPSHAHVHGPSQLYRENANEPQRNFRPEFTKPPAPRATSPVPDSSSWTGECEVLGVW